MMTFEQIAKLKPVKIDGRTLAEVIRDLNAEFKALEVEFGEYEFSGHLSGMGDRPFEDFGRVFVSAVPGGNEGYYVHINVSVRNGKKDEIVGVSLAKTWTWESALEISAVATRLLQWW